ncbi:MAG: NAD-binding protein [Candidatus Micrarchaeota archaeon]|nr:NAD-binding protein [Candidatus Micrarchaeota archaeon]
MASLTEIAAYVSALLTVLIFGIVGTYILGQHGGFNVRINSILDAAYFTIVTMSTIGYGDIYPVTPTAKVFVIVLVIGGLGIFLGSVAAITGEFMNRRIENLSGRLGSFEKRLMNKHIILIGSNTTNTYLAEKLSERNEKFIMITNDPTTSEHLKRLGYRAYVADSTSVVDMKEFEPSKAKALVIDLKDSSRAIYALLVAKELAGSSKIVVIAPTKDAEHHLRNIAAGRALVVNPADIAAKTISESIFK